MLIFGSCTKKLWDTHRAAVLKERDTFFYWMPLINPHLLYEVKLATWEKLPFMMGYSCAACRTALKGFFWLFFVVFTVHCVIVHTNVFWPSDLITKYGRAEVQWMSSATLWLLFITLVITEERVIPLIMKCDSIYSPPHLSFCTHAALCVTFWSELIIPAVIYVQCVHSGTGQIIVVNLTNSGDSPVWVCDGAAWT